MYKPFTLLIIHSGKPDLPKDDSPIRRRATADLNEIVLDSELDEVVIGYPRGPGPHTGFVGIPMMTGFHDGGLDIVENYIECIDGIFGRCMWWVELDNFGGS